MRIMLLLLFLLAMTSIGRGQPTGVRRYLDENLHFTTKKHAVYQANVIRDGTHWVMQVMYPDGDSMLHVCFADEQLSIKDGAYTIYYSNGKIWIDGRFIQNKATGIWQAWYNNGRLRDSGRVVDGHFSGQWKRWYAGGQLKEVHEYLSFDGEHPVSPDHGGDSSITIASSIDTLTIGYLTLSGITDGHWQSWYENGQPECDGLASHGAPKGVWKWFRENGQPSCIETYSQGKVVRLQCYDERGTFTGNSCSILKPAVFTDPVLSAEQYIARTLLKQYSLNRHDLGALQIRFTVTKTGKITHIFVPPLKDGAMRFDVLHVISTMPAWSPAISHNRFIDYQVSLRLY